MTDNSQQPTDPGRTSEFVRLLKQYDRRLAAYVHSFVPEWHEAEDVIQEASVRLWEQFEKFEPGTNFGAWACTIARYLIMERRKSSPKGHLYLMGELIGQVENSFEEVQSESDFRLQALQECFEKLTPSGRSLLSQCYEKGMRLTHVAKVTGRTVGSLYTSISRLRSQLHDCIERRLERERGQA